MKPSSRVRTTLCQPLVFLVSSSQHLTEVPTFFVAGNDTTSATISWMLFALTKNPSIQRKLREELLSVPDDVPTFDGLNGLRYLDFVVRETLRLYSPVVNVTRVAAADDVIPLGRPVKDKYGRLRDSVAYVLRPTFETCS